VILGLDVRESSLHVVRVDRHGRVIGRASQESATPAGAVDVVSTVAGDSPKRVGAAVRDPSDVAVADLVAAAAGAALVREAPRVVSRGTAVALAEQWRGAAQGASHVVALTSGYSVHAGIVANGRLVAGAHGLAGNAGWLALNPVEREDYRRFGGLEAEIGAGGIVRRMTWRIRAGDSSSALDMAGGQPAEMTVAHVFEAARQGDSVAVSVVRDTARYVGMAIANLVAILDPEVIVLGGLIAEAGDLLLEPARLEASRRVSPGSAATLQIVAGTLGDDAAALGAARAAMLDT
jgi:predicted NBD/HSP70 family sugar kinase